MGIMVGGLATMAPDKRAVLAREVTRALAAGTLTCFSTACVAGALYAQGETTQGDEASSTFIRQEDVSCDL